MSGFQSPTRSRLRLPQATDKVMQMFYFDEVWGPIIMWKTIIFNDVLDVERIHRALLKCIELGEWKKLGGRLRKEPVSGHYLIHIPEKFTSERPAAGFTHIDFDMPISQHPIASKIHQLPLDRKSAFVQPRIESADEIWFAHGDEVPRSIDDYLYSDRPQIHVHITRFTDATILGWSWLHSLMDGLGMKTFYDAWSLVLAEKEDQVLPMAGYEDAMAALGLSRPAKKWMFENSRMRFHQVVAMVLRNNILARLGLRRKDETRTIFLPAHLVAKLRAAAISQVEPTEFLSEGDVLVAFITRAIVLSELNKKKKYHDVVVTHAVDIRSRSPRVFIPGKAYVQNAMFLVFNVFKYGHDIGSLGSIARETRHMLMQQMDEEQIEARARWTRYMYDRHYMPLWVGHSTSLLIGYSNWTKADFFNTPDFGPAVISQGAPDEARANPLGKPAYFYPHTPGGVDHNAVSNIFTVLGKDGAGNYWIQGRTKPSIWESLEQAVMSID